VTKTIDPADYPDRYGEDERQLPFRRNCIQNSFALPAAPDGMCLALYARTSFGTDFLIHIPFMGLLKLEKAIKYTQPPVVQ